MNHYQKAVFFMEEELAAPACLRPLMLEAVLSRPILSWMSEKLTTDGVQRFFIVCDPEFAEEAKACFPEGADVTLSNQQKDLMEFLNTPDPVLVLNRSAFPFDPAGPGFVYAAAGYDLQETWKVKMTNAVQGAELVGGWLPVYGPETIAELEPALRELGF